MARGWRGDGAAQRGGRKGDGSGRMRRARRRWGQRDGRLVREVECGQRNERVHVCTGRRWRVFGRQRGGANARQDALGVGCEGCGRNVSRKNEQVPPAHTFWRCVLFFAKIGAVPSPGPSTLNCAARGLCSRYTLCRCCAGAVQRVLQTPTRQLLKGSTVPSSSAF